MQRPHLSSDQIWFLCAVWETRSLTLAARRSEISLATATRLIASARRLLQDPLFVRGGSGYVPTPRMTELMPGLAEARHLLTELARNTRFDPAQIEADIKIAGVDNAIFGFFTPCLRRLLAEAPGLHFSLQTLPRDWPQALESGEIDLLFYAPPMNSLPSGLRSAPILLAEHVLVVRMGHPILKRLAQSQAEGREPPAEALDDYSEIEITYGPLSSRKSGETSFPFSAGNAAAAVECDYFLASAFMVLESDLYVRLPRFTAERLAKYLPIAFLPPEMRSLPPWRAHMIWHERTDLDPAHIWLRRVIINNCKLPSSDSSQS